MSRSRRERLIAAAWIVGVWCFVAVLQATQRYLRGRELEPNPWVFWNALGVNLALAAIWAAATPVVIRIARRYPFPGRSLRVLAAIHLPAAAAIALLHTFVSNIVYKVIVAPGVSWAELLANCLHSAVMTGPTRIATYLQIVGVTWGLDDYRAWREGEIRASHLQAQLARERLEVLKMQLHPAFLFQTLALLRSTIRRDPRAAARTIVELGDLLRLSLRNGGQRLVRLAEEIRYADLYLRIESTRLERKLGVRLRVPREVLDAAVPSRVLQPLVEAAVAAAHPDPARVEISAERRDERMTLRVHADRGKPGRPAPPSASADAIARARRRLDLEYPGGHRLEWSSLTGEAVVEIPFVRVESAESFPLIDIPDSIPPRPVIPRTEGPRLASLGMTGTEGLAMTQKRRLSWKQAALVLGAWTAVGLFRAVERYTLDPVSSERLEFGFREALAQNLLFSYLWAAFTPLVAELARRYPISGGPRPRIFGVHLAASAIFAVGHGTLFALAYPALMGMPFGFLRQLRAVPSVLTIFLFANLLTYWGVVGVCWAIQAVRLSRERELRASQLEAQLAGARLVRLQTQLHPHFLFNALNSVLPLVFRDREAAARTISRLEELLRRSLEVDAAQLVPLSRELEFLEMYVEIQTTRFQDRLKVVFDVPSELSSARVPNLILQPLVENAIKHGVSAQPGCGKVEISARREKGMLVLRVRDDGPGLLEPPRFDGSGVGLANTRARLEQLYGADQRLDLENIPEGGLEVTLGLPFSTDRGLRTEDRGLSRHEPLPSGVRSP